MGGRRGGGKGGVAEYLMEGDEVLKSIEGHTSLKRGQAVGGQLKSNGSMASRCSSQREQTLPSSNV